MKSAEVHKSASMADHARNVRTAEVGESVSMEYEEAVVESVGAVKYASME